MRSFFYGLILCTQIIFSTLDTSGQSYGVAFSSHEMDQDKRTALDLTPSGPIALGGRFKVSFDMIFRPGQQVYFGYIFRLISDRQKNIDLIYDESRFRIVLAGDLTGPSLELPTRSVSTKWYRFDVEVKDGDIVLSCDGRKVQGHVGTDMGRDYRILFGANDFRQFRSTDLPPMSLKDIRVSINGNLAHEWQLNESAGNVATDHIRQQNGTIKNPVWIRSLHNSWNNDVSMKVKGAVSAAYDAEKDVLYLISNDSLVAFGNGLRERKVFKYRSGRRSFLYTNQSICLNSKLYNLSISQRTVNEFDFASLTWRGEQDSQKRIDYWHANKFYSKRDSSIYMIGGYGQLQYKNTVQRYRTGRAQWDTVRTKGDALTPRYLAGLGSNSAGDTTYILGGYGSATGKQIVNPRNLYDLIRFTTKDHQFKKIYQLNAMDNDFAFANSLIIEPGKNKFYGLIFEPHRYQTRLQLIEGDLSKPKYRFVASKIPYNFHDTQTFADLFYCPRTKVFYALTIDRRDDDNSYIKIYSLLGPPEDIPASVAVRHTRSSLLLALLGGLGALTLLFYLIRWWRKKRSYAGSVILAGVQAVPANVNGKAVEIHRSDDLEISQAPVEDDLSALTTVKQGNILLFGGFQINSSKQIDINVHFTPLLKELFLIILVHTLRWKNGVSPERLNELLWFDKSDQSAKNNRSVNIAKLRTVLELIGNCQLIKESGYWKLLYDHRSINVDYAAYLELISNKKDFDRKKILKLIDITQRGAFLKNNEFEWLDQIKSDISFDVIDVFMRYINSIRIEDDPELVVRIVNSIFHFDPVHEEGLSFKCKALNCMGNQLLSKSAIDNFKREYQLIYGEPYDKDLSDLLKARPAADIR